MSDLTVLPPNCSQSVFSTIVTFPSSSGEMVASLSEKLKRASKPFRQISVTEICEEAAIGRKTFYRNFELREDVIDFQLDLMCDEYQTELARLPIEQKQYHHFSYIQRNADYFISLYQNGLDQLAYEKFSVILPVTMPVWSDDEVEQEYRSAYMIAGIEAIQHVWISRGCKESIEQVVDIAFRAQEKQIPISHCL